MIDPRIAESKSAIIEMLTALDVERVTLRRHIQDYEAEIERLRTALEQAYIDGGCRPDEAAEMVAAIKKSSEFPSGNNQRESGST